MNEEEFGVADGRGVGHRDLRFASSLPGLVEVSSGRI